jgi:hypothetical protein
MLTHRWAVTQIESVHIIVDMVRGQRLQSNYVILLTCWTKITADRSQNKSAIAMHSTLRPVGTAQIIVLTRSPLVKTGYYLSVTYNIVAILFHGSSFFFIARFSSSQLIATKSRVPRIECILSYVSRKLYKAKNSNLKFLSVISNTCCIFYSQYC